MKSRLEETDKPETENNEVGQRTEAYNRAAMLYARGILCFGIFALNSNWNLYDETIYPF